MFSLALTFSRDLIAGISQLRSLPCNVRPTTRGPKINSVANGQCKLMHQKPSNRCKQTSKPDSGHSRIWPVTTMMNNARGVIILTVVDSGPGRAVGLVDNSRSHQSIQLYMLQTSHAVLSVHKFECVYIERPGTSTDRYRPYLA